MKSQTCRKFQTLKNVSTRHFTIHNKQKNLDNNYKSTPALSIRNKQNSLLNATQISIKGFLVQEQSRYEDGRKSKFTYYKLIIIEKMIFFMSLIQLFLGFFQAEASEITRLQKTQINLLVIMSVLTLCLVAMVIFRKLLILQLGIDQRFIYNYSHKKLNSLSPAVLALLIDKSNLIQLSIQVFLVSLHPNPVTQNYFVELRDMEYNMMIKYNINFVISYFMITKFYITFRSLVALFRFSTTRAARVCNMLSVEYTFMYRVKCLQREYPIKSIMFVALLVIIIFSFALRVSQGKVSFYNNVPVNGFEKIENCIWFIFITMYTVGYGDLVPITSFGRVIASLAAISGIFFNTIMIVSLSNYLQERLDESRARYMLQKLSKRQKMQKKASNALSEIVQLTEYLKKENGKEKTELIKKCEENIEKLVKSTKFYRSQLKQCSPEENTWYSMDQKFEKLHKQFKKFQQKQKVFNDIMKHKFSVSTPKITEIYKKIVRNSLNCYTIAPQ